MNICVPKMIEQTAPPKLGRVQVAAGFANVDPKPSAPAEKLRSDSVQLSPAASVLSGSQMASEKIKGDGTALLAQRSSNSPETAGNTSSSHAVKAVGEEKENQEQNRDHYENLKKKAPVLKALLEGLVGALSRRE